MIATFSPAWPGEVDGAKVLAVAIYSSPDSEDTLLCVGKDGEAEWKKMSKVKWSVRP